MIGVSGRDPISWNPRAIGEFGLSSLVVGLAKRGAAPSGYLSKLGGVECALL
jgi:hypothetical protein